MGHTAAAMTRSKNVADIIVMQSWSAAHARHANASIIHVFYTEAERVNINCQFHTARVAGPDASGSAGPGIQTVRTLRIKMRVSQSGGRSFGQRQAGATARRVYASVPQGGGATLTLTATLRRAVRCVRRDTFILVNFIIIFAEAGRVSSA